MYDTTFKLPLPMFMLTPVYATPVTVEVEYSSFPQRVSKNYGLKCKYRQTDIAVNYTL